MQLYIQHICIFCTYNKNMHLILLLLIIFLQFSATISVPGLNVVKALHKFYRGTRFSYNPCGGVQHDLLDQFYVEYFSQSVANEYEIVSKINVYTLLYMIRWKANQNRTTLEKQQYIVPLTNSTVKKSKNLYKEICSAVGEVHSMAYFKIYWINGHPPAESATTPSQQFGIYTMLTCNALKIKHTLGKAMDAINGIDDGKQWADGMPKCEDWTEALESVEGSAEEIMEWLLSDLLLFFPTRKKLIKYFDEARERDDFNELKQIWQKFVRFIGIPRMTIICNAHRKQLSFLISDPNNNYANMYKAFYREDKTKIAKWRTKIVLEKCLYDDWMEKIFDDELWKIASTDDDFNVSEELNTLRIEIFEQIRVSWMVYSETFWKNGKKIVKKIEQLARESKGILAKMQNLLIINSKEIEEQNKSGHNTEIMLLWENGPEDVALLRAMAICAKESFDGVHKVGKSRKLEAKNEIRKYAETFSAKFVMCVNKNLKYIKRDKMLETMHFERICQIIDDQTFIGDTFRAFFSKHENLLKEFLNSKQIDQIRKLMAANEYLTANERFSVSSNSSADEEEDNFTEAIENFNPGNEKVEINSNEVKEGEDLINETEFQEEKLGEEEGKRKKEEGKEKKIKWKKKEKKEKQNDKKKTKCAAEKLKKDNDDDNSSQYTDDGGIKRNQKLKKEIKYPKNNTKWGSPSSQSSTASAATVVEENGGKKCEKAESATINNKMPSMDKGKAPQFDKNLKATQPDCTGINTTKQLVDTKSQNGGNPSSGKDATNLSSNLIYSHNYFSVLPKDNEMDYFEFKVKKISKFSDDNFLRLMYEQLIDIVMKQNSEDISKMENPFVNSLIRVLEVGVYVNEIYHRIKAMEQLREITKNQLQLKMHTFKKFNNNFDGIMSNISGIDLSKGTDVKHLLKTLHLDLKRLLLINGGAICPAEQTDKKLTKEICTVTNQMHLRQLTKCINGGQKGTTTTTIGNYYWDKMDENRKKQILLALIKFGNDTKNKLTADNFANIFDAFEKQKFFYQNFEAQRKLDENLLSQYQNDEFLMNFVDERKRKNFMFSRIENFSEFFQEIKCNQNDNVFAMVLESLVSKGFMQDKEHLFKVVNELKQLVEEWSDEARLQLKNTYFIKYQNEGIEPICLLPGGFERQKIFGNFINCDTKTKCEDGSLFCKFCNNSIILFVQKYDQSDHLSLPLSTAAPTLEMIFMDVHIKISFIFVPILRHLPLGNYNTRQIDRIGQILALQIENLLKNDNLDEAQYKFEQRKRSEQKRELNEELLNKSNENAKEIEQKIQQLQHIDDLLERFRAKALAERIQVKEMEAMLAILSNYGGELKILNFILLENDEIDSKIIVKRDSKRLNTFLQADAFLEQWAMNNHIFNGEIGYLDSKMLKIMLTKVFLLYQNSSLPFVLEAFFLTFSTWNWPLPIQLEELVNDQKRSGQLMVWSPGRERFHKLNQASKSQRKRLRKVLAMPIIWPMFPEQNLGKEISLQTAQVIQWKLREALTQFWENNSLAVVELLKPKKFTDMYNDFIVISCAGPQHIFEKFRAFVGKRIALELADFVEAEFLGGDFIEYLHLYPTSLSVQTTQNNAGTNCVNTYNSKLTNNKHDSSTEKIFPSQCKKLWVVGIRLGKVMDDKLRNKFEATLNTNFDTRTVNDFQEFAFYNVELKSKMVKWKELPNLGFADSF